MASITVRSLVSCLTGKLDAREVRDANDPKYLVYNDDGKLVGFTKVSHGWRRNQQISAPMRSVIRRQLKLSANQQLDLLVDCTITRDEYLRIADP